jgi:hypothetical protein
MNGPEIQSLIQRDLRHVIVEARPARRCAAALRALQERRPAKNLDAIEPLAIHFVNLIDLRR